MPLEQPKMRTSRHASKIENSPAHVGYMMCETVPQATPRQTQEVVVGWTVDWRVSMLKSRFGGAKFDRGWDYVWQLDAPSCRFAALIIS